MGNYRIDPKTQFSKRLARWTAVFWFVYMLWLSVLMLLQPQVALYSFYMGLISTVVMIVNEIAYTRNSIMEKMAYTLLDKTRLELKLPDAMAQKDDDDPTDEGEVIADEHGGEG